MSISVRGVVATLLALVVAASCARLGVWQLDRLAQRRARNASVEQAMGEAPLVLADSIVSVIREPGRYVYRIARIRGSYQPGSDLILRGRSDSGNPGVNLVTPMSVRGDTVVMVNRGWVPADDAMTVDPRGYAEPGEVEVRGILLPASTGGDGGPLAIRAGSTAVQSFSTLPLDSLNAAGGPAILPLYLQQLGSDSLESRLKRVPMPTLSEGSHLGYAIQWFSFAAIALGGLGLLLVRSRPRQ